MLELLLFVAVVYGLGATFAWSIANGTAKAMAANEKLLRNALGEAESRETFIERRLSLRDRQLKSASSERDDFAKIAATHDVTGRWNAGEWARKVWKDRRYSGHPKQNLESLLSDFEQFADSHVLVSLDIEMLGGWKNLLERVDGQTGITTAISAGDTMLFEGTGTRVLEQIVTFVRDDDTGFWKAGQEGEAGRWQDPDSPMIWRLTVDVLRSKTPPGTEFVEVLRVQKEFVETVVEKPVLRNVPDDVATSLSHHTREEIITLIEAVLEVRDLGLSERIEAQRALLPQSLLQPELEAAPNAQAQDSTAEESSGQADRDAP